MSDKRNLIRAGLLSVAAAAVLCAQGTPTLTTLYSFKGGDHDGMNPYAAVTVAKGGVLYGTTNKGGKDNDGVVYSLKPPASPGEPWREKVLFHFQGTDGAFPEGSLVIGANGVLYGTTEGQVPYGGRAFDSVAFSLTPPSASGDPWAETVLYNFDCCGPDGLVFGPGGALYGAQALAKSTAGTVFSLAPPASTGSPWTENVLYSAPNRRGGNPPTGPVVIGNDGVLFFSMYGVYSLTPPASPGGAWTEAALGGEGNTSGVVIGAGGVLYGATTNGGTGTTCNGGQNGCGTVFALTPPASPGGAWTQTVLHNFTGENDGSNPNGLLIGPGDVLYGTTQLGGTFNSGTIYSLTPPATPGGEWTETVLYSFTGGADGAEPVAGLVFGPGGVLYGTTAGGGISNNGTVFAFQP